MTSLLAVWYHHSPEGQRFLEAREIRVMLAAAGIVTAYVLLRTRRRLSRREPRRWAVARWVTGSVVTTGLWLWVDWVRGEDWIAQLVRDLPDPHENGVRHSVLIAAGWLGWSIAVSEGLRWATILRQRHQAEAGSCEA